MRRPNCCRGSGCPRRRTCTAWVSVFRCERWEMGGGERFFSHARAFPPFSTHGHSLSLSLPLSPSPGVVLWELVTGESPRNRQLRHVVAGDAPPAECPAAVAAVIEACRARDPASRPTARELFDILVATPAVPRPSGAAGAASGGGGGGTGGTSGEGPASTPTPSPATGDASAGPTTGASGGLATASAASAASGGVGGGGGSGRSRAPPSAFG